DPIVIGVRGDVRPLIGISTEIEDLWKAQIGKGIGPEQQLSAGPLLHEHELPVVIPQSDQLLIVVDIEERLSGTLCSLPGQVRDEIVSIEVNLVGHVTNF